MTGLTENFSVALARFRLLLTAATTRIGDNERGLIFFFLVFLFFFFFWRLGLLGRENIGLALVCFH